MKKFFTLLALMLLCSVGAWADGIQKYTPTNRVTELQDGHSYIVYFAGLPTSQDRTGVVYERGGDQVGFYCSKKPHNGFNTTSNRFLWTVTAASDANGYYLQNVGTSKYVGSDGRANKDAASKPEVYIYQWKADGVESAGVDVESAAGTRVANASSSFDNEKVWIVKNNASEYWHANIGSFTTWSSGHPVAFYEYTTETVETVDYTITFAGTGTGTVKCGEEVLTNGQTYTSSKLLSSSDITVEGCNYSVIIDDINMIVTVNLYGLPKISTSSEKFYYTLKDTKGRNNYAYYNGDSQYLGINTAAGNDNRYFYFTQSAAQQALSTADYKVVSIHNIAAGNKEMTAFNSWGTTETNWYIKLSPKVTDTPNYIAVCPNSSFGNDSWNDYSTKVDVYGANDNNSAWEFVSVNVTEFTVQVSGLPTATDLAGVTVYGANYNNGAKVSSGHRDAFFSTMTAMVVPGYTACVTGRSNAIRVAYTEKIKASDAPEGENFAENTTWYYIKSKNSNGYISNGSAYKQDANFKFNNTTKPTDADGLWALVYNEETGTYKIYNKNAGTGSVMAHNATTDDSPVYLANSTDAANSDFILEPGVQAGTYCIRINGTTNVRWNNRTYLSTWASNDSFYGGGNQGQVNGGSGNGAIGSQYIFEVYEPIETSLPAAWNNYSGEDRTTWTQGTDEIVTANTANKTTHKYHEWNVRVADHRGDVAMTFQYTKGVSNGSARLDVSCVEVLNAEGVVVSSDVHNGYSGGNNDKNTYTISFPEKNTDYTLRVWSFDTQNSFGTITYDWVGSVASEFEVASAKALIKNGVGYPTTESTGYANLAAINEESTKAEVNAAKAAYIAETNINLPVSGKAYKLNFLHNNTAKTKRYIKYDANGLGLTTEAGEAATILFTEVDATNHKYIMSLSDGNLLTWQGDGNEGFKVDGATAKGYSTMVANQGNNDDWNLCWFANQGTDEAQLGTIKMSSPRHANNAANSCWVISNAGAWAKANEASFFASNGATSALQFEEVAGVTGETTGYADGVEKYTLYTTAKANETTYASYFGTGLGKYHYGENQTTGYMDAVKACTTLEEERNVVPVSINQPEAGKFYRFKGLGHSVRDSKSYYMSAGNAGEALHYTEDTDGKTIFYLTSDSKLLSYSTGLYANGVNIAQIGNNGTYTFDATPANNTVQGTVKGIGTYRIYHGSGYLVDWANNGNLQNCGDGNNGWAAWEIEEVEELPVTIATSGYSTFNCPVQTKVADGVTAYTASVDVTDVNNPTITYTKIEDGVIPANVAVLLKGEGATTISVNKDEAVTGVTSDLGGTVAAMAISQSTDTQADKYYYVLSNGTFKYSTGTKINGFKGYLHIALPYAGTAGSNFRVIFEDGGIATGIESLDMNSNAAVYDLQGRRVNNARNGMFIVNGKKVIR